MNYDIDIDLSACLLFLFQNIVELLRKGHQQKQPSVTLDMYEPHWSAANRYLEMASGEVDNNHHKNYNSNTNDDDDNNIHNNIETLDSYYNDADTNTNNNSDINNNNNNNNNDNNASSYNSHPKDTSEPMLLNTATATPKGISTSPRVPHLPGAVPSNWTHPSDVQR